MKVFIISCLLFIIILSSCSRNPTEPEKFKPDLIIQSVNYAHVSQLIIVCSIDIRNIGNDDFNGILYIASATEEYFQRNGYYEGCSLMSPYWLGDSIRPALIKVDQIINGHLGLIVPNDTCVIRLRIETDNAFLGYGVILPAYDESNYDNNEYKFKVIP